MTTYAGEDVGKGEHSSTAGGSANFFSHFGDQYGSSPGKWESVAIPLLVIYPNDSYPCNKDICSTMFIAALFVIARTWKQPRCPSTEEWIKKMWHIYTMEYYSAEKKIMESLNPKANGWKMKKPC